MQPWHLHFKSTPLRSTVGECLLEGHHHCASGYLQWLGPTTRSLGLCVLEVEIQFLSDNLSIANFIKPKSKLGFLESWLEALNYEIKWGKVTFYHEFGQGFLYLKCDTIDTTKHVFMQTPFQSDFGSCVIHPWVPTFDGDNPSGLQLPTWIMIKWLSLEYLQFAHVITTEVGEALGCDHDNASLKHPRFCVHCYREGLGDKSWICHIST